MNSGFAVLGAELKANPGLRVEDLLNSAAEAP